MSQIPVATTKATPNEYLNLWQRCVVNPDSSSQIDAAVKRIKSHEALYQQAVAGTKIPWFCVGIIDEMECGCDQTKHIHNGDPLMKRTVQVPAGRPTSGDGPFTKLESITDWIQLKHWNQWHDWDVASILFRFEANNGFAYRNYRVNTPYLWSGSNLYTAGKFIKDRVYSKTAISKQIGAALLLKAFV